MSKVQELEALVASLTAEVAAAKSAAVVETVVYVKNARQQDEALELLFDNAVLRTKKFASLLNLQDRHMQTLMTYLRRDGWLVTKGGEYSLLVNEYFIKTVGKRVLKPFMQHRLDEYNLIKELRAKRSA